MWKLAVEKSQCCIDYCIVLCSIFPHFLIYFLHLSLTQIQSDSPSSNEKHKCQAVVCALLLTIVVFFLTALSFSGGHVYIFKHDQGFFFFYTLMYFSLTTQGLEGK